jgi:hypothetical protein
MTTENKFFEKIFIEGEKAVPLYRDYNFDVLSEKEKSFLKSLTFFSKYKDFFKRWVISRKVTTNDQLGYIESFKQQLDYSNYIKIEQAKSRLTEMKQMTALIYGFGFIGTMIVIVIRKDPSKGIVKEGFYSLLGWIIVSGLFYKWSLREYKSMVSDVYKNLENELNTNIALKSGKLNPNYFSSDEIDDLID